MGSSCLCVAAREVRVTSISLYNGNTLVMVGTLFLVGELKRAQFEYLTNICTSLLALSLFFFCRTPPAFSKCLRRPLMVLAALFSGELARQRKASCSWGDIVEQLTKSGARRTDKHGQFNS
ncbi:hypothetical protein B0H14DRAFT_2613780 [Mycena olivaceomarginata]|nr:hypothetical protein B0H14DRAFT_2613780 [Mycena olivaceomarginata]